MGINRYNVEGYPDPTVHAALSNIEAEQKKIGFRPLVYICSPYAGAIERNTQNARRYCRFAVDRKAIPVAPHLFLPQFMNDNDKSERELALFMARIFLTKCNSVWVFGRRITNGMAGEIHKAKCRGLPIRYFEENCEEIINER